MAEQEAGDARGVQGSARLETHEVFLVLPLVRLTVGCPSYFEERVGTADKLASHDELADDMQLSRQNEE